VVVTEAPTGAGRGLDTNSIIEVLNEIPHPDTGIGIVDLGLVYGVEVQGRNVRVRMTMMQPDNPSRGLLVDEVETMIRARFREVRAVSVELVWDPPWHPEMMTDRRPGKAQLQSP